MGFKEHGRFVVFLAVLTGPSWGQSRPGLQGPDTLAHPKGTRTAPLYCLQQCRPSIEAFAPCTAPTCHSPTRLQATDTGGGHAGMPGDRAPIACRSHAHNLSVSPPDTVASNRYRKRHVDMHVCADRQRAPDTIARCNSPTARTTTPPPCKKRAGIVRCQPRLHSGP